jgi:hypothetical protein
MALCSDCVSKIKYIGDGSQTDFTFPFEYMESSDVYVAQYDDETKEYTNLVGGADWNFKNATTIEIQPAPDYTFVIYRCTEIDPIKATFHPGHPIKAGDLNDNFEQLQSAIEDTKCSINQLNEHVDENYWNNHSQTIECGDEWIGDDEHIATNCAIDARFWNKAEDTTFINDPWDIEADDRHVPTTGAVQKYVRDEFGNLILYIQNSLVTSEDERLGRWHRQYNDDQHIITAKAASQRFDVVVSDDNPEPNSWIQPGKMWIDANDQKLYYWNGTYWVQPIAGGGGGAGGIGDAPSDGITYGRNNGSWVPTETFTTGNITVEPDTPLTRKVSGGQVEIGFDITQLASIQTAHSFFNS